VSQRTLGQTRTCYFAQCSCHARSEEVRGQTYARSTIGARTIVHANRASRRS
jgi:hypothetical protein